MYKCKYCGKRGTKEELRRHVCTNGEVRHYHDDDSLLTTLILLEMMDNDSGLSDSFPTPTDDTPSIDPGGGDFDGGGASGSYDFGDSSSSYDSGSSDSCSCGGGCGD